MSKQNFDSEELVKLFHKIHQRLDWLTCAIKECCSKIPINIGAVVTHNQILVTLIKI